MSRSTAQRVVSHAAHQSQTKTFLKIMERIASSEGWREEQTLTHWLSLSCMALASKAHSLRLDQVRVDRTEAQYVTLANSFRHRGETLMLMSEALAVIVDALEQEMADVLSPIFSEIAAASSLGQFFTPYSLSLVCAENAMQDAVQMLDNARREGRHFLLMHEPACGVGGMILAANNVLRSHGIDPSREVHWHATDVDWRAVCGAYIQLTLTGASADITHGNSLSGETHDVLPTLMAVMYPKRLRRRTTESSPDSTPEVLIPTSSEEYVELAIDGTVAEVTSAKATTAQWAFDFAPAEAR